MKQLVKNFTFSPANKTITFAQPFDLADFLLITNVSTNQIIYNFADPAAGGVLSNNTLTLDFDTTAMAATDALQIFVDVPDESSNLLFRILQMLMSPLGYDKSLQRQRGTVIIESGTVATLNNIAAIDSLQPRIQIYGVNATAWADTVRARIT